MVSLDSLVDDILGLPRGYTATAEVRRSLSRRSPLQKAMPGIKAILARTKERAHETAKVLAGSDREVRIRDLARMNAEAMELAKSGKIDGAQGAILDGLLHKRAMELGL